MSRYALIKSATVVNIIAWDGPTSSPMTFDTGVSYVAVSDDQYVDIGWAYTNGEFTAPAED